MDEMKELFYRDPYCREFDAVVTACRPGKNGFEVSLDDTAFYPEGGGQPADHGTLNDAVVSDVRKKEDVIWHTTDREFAVGEKVHGVLDWQRRFDHMQQHTGEHMMPGIIHQHFGFENVGFHLSEENILIDFDGVFTWEDLMAMEQEANEAIWANKPIQISFPDAEELKSLEYRSKKELSGVVRIVTIPGCDVCACCGTHVARTGEVGMIKCVSLEKHKEGVRVTLLCGSRALQDYRVQLRENTAISHLLSAKLFETSASVQSLQEHEAELRRQLNDLRQKYFALKAESLTPAHLQILQEDGASGQELKDFGNALLSQNKAEIVALFGRGASGYTYLLMSNTVNLRDAGKALNQRLNGRGGGKPELIQGTVQGSPEEIRSTLQELLGSL